METSKSDYRFKFIDDVLVIEDLNLGRMSVTNNAEDVISEIRTSTDRRLTEHFIIYKDSEGVWDQMIPSYSLSGCSEVFFKHIGETNLEDAITKLRESLTLKHQ
jgi:hypothetical protein